MSESDKITFQNTKFGEVTIERGNVLKFPYGLPGFERHRDYGIVEVEEEVPFLRLLALDEPRLGFVIVNPMLLWPDYDPDIGQEDLQSLGITEVQQLAIYCIVTLSTEPGQVTANLRGPICINTDMMQAKQMILLDERYNTKHSIMESSSQEA
jgi:flagellar assembly factor FliW